MPDKIRRRRPWWRRKSIARWERAKADALIERIANAAIDEIVKAEDAEMRKIFSEKGNGFDYQKCTRCGWYSMGCTCSESEYVMNRAQRRAQRHKKKVV